VKTQIVEHTVVGSVFARHTVSAQCNFTEIKQDETSE